MQDLVFSTASKILLKGSHCGPQDGVKEGAPLPGDFRVIVSLTPQQMNDFCDFLGTLDAPVSKIASVKEGACILFFLS
jgi:hypothetical protein